MSLNESSEHRLIRLPEVMKLSGLSRTSVYRAVRLQTFPLPVKLGGRAVAWRLSEVVDWIDSREPAHRPT